MRSRPLPARLLFSRTLLFVILILLRPEICLAEKTDTVLLKNGDKITGEVKSLARGKLDYSTDDAGRPAIEWVKVAQVSSPHTFEVEMATGAKYFGQLGFTGRNGTLAVRGSTVDTLAIPSVVRISTLDAGFFQRVRAYLDVGFTFAKANKATTFNTSGEAAYRGDRYGSKFTLDSYAQGQESTATVTRNSVGLNVTRYLPKRWSAVAFTGAEQNDELNLALRFTGAGALGRALIQSNSSEVSAGGGLAVTRERFTQTDPSSTEGDKSKTNLEGMLVAQWDAFRYDSPKLDFSTTFFLYPSITTPGRLRGELSTRLKYELFHDFNVGVNLTDTFDSRPPEETAQTNDYIMSFTIGWSYRR